MREIKFRAWDNKEKEWLLGYDMPALGGFSLFGEIMALGEWEKVLGDYIFTKGTHKPDDLKVMQFTGLKDKNGVEIYEGDIVKTFTGNKTVVDFDNGAFRVKVTGYGGSTNGKYPIDEAMLLEVIGNVHENPELLEVKK